MSPNNMAKLGIFWCLYKI